MTKKRVALLLAVLLIVGVAIGVTLAYLTHQTGEVKNTFTFGDVKITLDEVNLDESINALRTTTGNVYHLLPGESLEKDPTVTVLKGSEKCYVRIFLSHNNVTAFDSNFAQAGLGAFFKGLEVLGSGWRSFGHTRVGDVRTYEFRWEGTGSLPVDIVDAMDASVALPALFTEVMAPTTATAASLAAINPEENPLQVVLVAQAIQASGFTSAAEAWATVTPWGGIGSP